MTIPLAPIGRAAPTSKLSSAQHCIGTFARCKSARGRRYRPALPDPSAARSAACQALLELMDRTPSKPRAALWMAGWLALMLIVAVAGRETTRELNVFQIMEVRSVLGFFMLYPLIRMNGGFAAMKTSRPLQHIGRNLIHYGAQLGWFFALTLIPLGQVVSIEFTMPIWTAILAASFLGERMTVWKIAAIVLGRRRRHHHRSARDRRDQSGPVDRARRRRRIRHLRRHDEIADPHRTDAGDHFLDAGDPVRRRIFAVALRLAMAVRLCLGLARRDRVLRHVLALLHGAGDAVCRCDRGDADGLPAGSADGRRSAG